MNRTYCYLLLVLVPVLMAGRWCSQWWPASFGGVMASENGRIFTLVRKESFREAEIWEWSADLSRHWTLLNVLPNCRSFRCSRDGTLLFWDTGSAISAFDTQQGLIRWSWEKGAANSITNIKLMDDDRHLLLLGRTQQDVVVLDAQSGRLIDGIGSASRAHIKRYAVQGNVIAVESYDGRREGYRLVQGRLHPIESAEQRGLIDGGLIDYRPIAGPSVLRNRMRCVLSQTRVGLVTERSDTAASTIKIMDRRSGRTIHQAQLGSSAAAISLVLVAVAFVAVICTMLLVQQGVNHPNRGKAFVDLGVFLLCLSLLCVGVSSDLMPQEVGRMQAIKVVAMFGAALSCLLFLLFLCLRSPDHLWLAIFVGCAFPFLLPLVGLALLLRLCDFHSPFVLPPYGRAFRWSREKLRFGIFEMLLGIAAAATLFGLGVSSLFLVPLGFAVAVLLLVSILLSLHHTAAMATVGTCSLAIVLFVCGNPFYWTGVLVLIPPLVFSFLSVYGYAMQRPIIASVPLPAAQDHRLSCSDSDSGIIPAT
ncbi:MAG: hypothetical protein MI861_03250 [Pirellulales bacterium]|nr:hypothetical protein [Pirellulales bacterium]